VTGRSKYRWPLLISVPALVLGGLPTSWRRLPASDPGDFSSESVAEIDHRRVQLFLRDGGPEFQLVALAVALVAVVTAGRDVDGEVSGTVGGGAMHGTATVPLIAGPLGGLEGEQVEDLFHGDFAAEAVEVDVTSSSVDRMHIYGFRSKNRDVTTDRHAPRRKT